MARNLAFFDVETTIVDGKTRITEFAAIVLEENGLYQVESFSTLVGTGSHPTFAQVGDKIYDVLNGRVWVGFNLKESVDQLYSSFVEVGRECPQSFMSLDLSTLPALRKAFPSGLTNLAQHFGLGQPRHRALEDCRMMMDILKSCATALFLQSHLPRDHVADRKGDQITTPEPLVFDEPVPVEPVPEPASSEPEPEVEPQVPAKKPARAWAILNNASPVPSPVVAPAAPPAAVPAMNLESAEVVAPVATAAPKIEAPVVANIPSDAKPLNTAWADLVAPHRPKTELSYEINKKNNKNRKVGNKPKVPQGKDSTSKDGKRVFKPRNNQQGDGKNRPVKTKADNANKRQPRRKSKSNIAGSGDEPQQEEGWNVSVSKMKIRQTKKKENEKRSQRDTEDFGEGNKGKRPFRPKPAAEATQ